MAFQPHMTGALLPLHAYHLGMRSRRPIKRLCERDVAFRDVASNLRPDHSTVAWFRQRHTASLKGFFTDILRFCREAGLVKVGVV
jgi:transposase